jgi:hypothetical protein
MKTYRLAAPFLLTLLAFTPVAAQEKRALEHEDYALWNQIQDDVLSTDGRWLAYRLVPGDGDASLVIQALEGTSTTSWR